MYPHELRLCILQALLLFDHSGDSSMPEAWQLAERFGVSLQDILDQFDILDAEGAVTVYRVGGGGGGTSALITGIGKRMVEEKLQDTSQSKPEAPSTDSTRRAAELLEGIVSELSATTFRVSNLSAYLRKYLMAIRLLGWDEKWIVMELNGCSNIEQAPPWRQVDNIWYLLQPIAELIDNMHRGLSLPAYELIKSTNGYSMHKVPADAIKKTIDKIAERLFDHVSKAVITLRFGEVAASVFRKYQDYVDQALAHLGIEEHLKSAYQNLLVHNEASWQLAVMACRNILQKLSDTLWQSTDNDYPYLKDGKGSATKVHRDNVRNRIRAYLHQKGLRSEDMLMNMIDPLYSMGSAGKRTVSYEHAQSVLIHTYIFLGEMLRLTDMQPITKVHEI